ncbi:MAG TPA: GNAT family N-acetyltransferase [Cyclobacteriaceae bacterium]|nr:GNAT family N-acetyltransferase [Cyclobacteriaceae bacterium]
MITVDKVDEKQDLDKVFQIREEVFVKEQQVSPEEEYDKFEAISTHFLAKVDGQPAGTARWRKTPNGIKLERFAVLQSMRGKGVGQALVKAVLDDIVSHPNYKGELLYLHAQLTAVPLYEKFGFQKEGDIFMECNIAHYTMKKSTRNSLA